MQYLLGAVVGVIALYYVYLFVRDWRAHKHEAGSFTDNLWAAGQRSATKFWARVAGIIASIMTELIVVSDKLDIPQVSSTLKHYFDPETVTMLFLVFSIVVEVARNRRRGMGK